MLVEQAGGVRSVGLGVVCGTVEVGPLRALHLLARAGLGLHARRVDGGSDCLAVSHRHPALPHHTTALAHSQADARVATVHLTRGHGRASEHRSGLAHVHTSLRGLVGGVRVAAGLHDLALAVGGEHERAVARDAAVQGVERTADQVLDGEHGECAFCPCWGGWVWGYSNL